jgi:hypothetical protein
VTSSRFRTLPEVSAPIQDCAARSAKFHGSKEVVDAGVVRGRRSGLSCAVKVAHHRWGRRFQGGGDGRRVIVTRETDRQVVEIQEGAITTRRRGAARGSS